MNINFDLPELNQMKYELQLPKSRLSLSERIKCLFTGVVPQEPYTLSFNIKGKGYMAICFARGSADWIGEKEYTTFTPSGGWQREKGIECTPFW